MRARMVCLGLAVACMAPLPAAPGVDAAVAAHRKKAAAHAAAGRWDRALAEIAAARGALRDDVRRAGRSPVKQPAPAFRKELQALNSWLRSQEARATGEPERRRHREEYARRRAALAKKHGVAPPGTPPDAAERARADLVDASLAETAARYHAGKGDAAHAEFARCAAYETRLRAYQALGRKTLAEQAAVRLLSLKSSQPQAYAAVARYYQEGRQYSRAADVWQRGIRLLESGGALLRARAGSPEAKRERGRHLGEFYRELAFCYSRLGRADEARRALESAALREVPKR